MSCTGFSLADRGPALIVTNVIATCRRQARVAFTMRSVFKIDDLGLDSDRAEEFVLDHGFGFCRSCDFVRAFLVQVIYCIGVAC